MSQSIPNNPIDEPAQGAPEPEGAGPAQGAPEPETDWKAEAKKWEARSKANHKRAKELEEKAARLDALEAANKTDAERLAAAEAKLAAYEKAAQAKAWADEVAAETGVPAHVLRGGSLEEMQAHAESLKAAFAPKAPVNPNQGRTPTGSDTDALAAVRALFGTNRH